MTFDFSALLQQTLTNPRAAASQLKALNLPANTGWSAMLLVSVSSALLGFLGFSMTSSPEMDPSVAVMFGSPLRTALIQFAVLALTGWLAYWVGRRFGGTGTLAQSLVLVAWVQVPPILLQVAQLVLIGLAQVLGLAGFVLYAVLLTLFIAELHGFRSALKVFFGLIVVSFLVGLGAAILLALMFGVPTNV